MISKAIVLVVLCATAANERETTLILAPKYKAETEVVLDDGSICDLVSKEYAIEVDYAPKWAEAIGQSIHYAEMTGKKPGIILLLRDPQTEWHSLVRCARLCGKLNIRLWVEEIH